MIGRIKLRKITNVTLIAIFIFLYGCQNSNLDPSEEIIKSEMQDNTILEIPLEEDPLYRASTIGNPPLMFGEEIKVSIGEEVETEPDIFTTFIGYEVITGNNGKKGIKLINQRINKTNNKIKFGLSGLNTSVPLYANYENITLLVHMPDMYYYSNDVEYSYYALERAIEYTDPSTKACFEETTIQPGEANICYNLIDYAGPGEYELFWPIITAEDGSGFGEKYRTIKIEVE